MSDKSILILGFGAPSTDEDSIRNFLTRLWKREVPERVIKEVLQRYKFTNSPSFLEKVKRFAQNVACLTGLEVKYSFFFTPPFFERMVVQGKEWIVLPLSPLHFRWFEKLIGRNPLLRVIQNWGLEEGYVELCGELIEGEEEVLFTYHSLPPDEVEYRENVFKLSEKIAGKAGVKSWEVAFQSGKEHWLSPSLEEIANQIRNKITVFPVGFIFECVETYYDLDVVFYNQLSRKGVEYKRITCVGERTEFLEFISGLLKKRIW